MEGSTAVLGIRSRRVEAARAAVEVPGLPRAQPDPPRLVHPVRRLPVPVPLAPLAVLPAAAPQREAEVMAAPT